MTQLANFRPQIESLLSLESLEEVLRNSFENGHLPALFKGFRFPPANVAETENEYLISLELPGMEEEDIEVKLVGNRLTVSGEQREETKEDGKQFHRLERSYGAFERTFELPPGVRTDSESVRATFAKGILEIRMTKAEPQPVAKIKVQASS